MTRSKGCALVIALVVGLSACGSSGTSHPSGGSGGAVPADWTVSYSPGGNDAAGKPRLGTEAMDLVPYEGHLFASTSSWEDPTGYPQVLRLDGAGTSWVVDASFDEYASAGLRAFSRVNALAALTFTTDGTGRPLAAPASLLVAAVTSKTEGDTFLFTRDDTNGRWTKVSLPTATARAQPRSLAVARDQVTGADRAYVGTRAGVFSGAYDPTVPGKIRWGATAEPGSDSSSGHRIMSLVTVGGVLHALAFADVLARTDGNQPSWHPVWHDDHVANPALCGPTCSGLRGGTEVPDPTTARPDLLLAEEGIGGRIIRLDPATGYAATVESQTDQLLAAKLGRPFRPYTITAYNRFTPMPAADGTTTWVTGVQAHSKDASADAGGSYLLTRHRDGTYTVTTIPYRDPPPPTRPSNRALVAVRAVIASPFAHDGMYISGYDCNGNPAHETAWIYHGPSPA